MKVSLFGNLKTDHLVMIVPGGLNFINLTV